jgi:hypothetical protein
MDYLPVESSSIAALGYDPTSRTLGVVFQRGATYHYAGVPEAVYTACRAASSIGGYVTANIRGRYPFTRIATEEGDAR